MSDDVRTTVDTRVEWGNRWPDGEVEVEYGVTCPECRGPGYMGTGAAEHAVRFLAESLARDGRTAPPVRRTVKVTTTIEYGPWEDA